MHRRGKLVGEASRFFLVLNLKQLLIGCGPANFRAFRFRSLCGNLCPGKMMPDGSSFIFTLKKIFSKLPSSREAKEKQ